MRSQRANLMLFVGAVGLALSCGTAMADHRSDVSWYTSSTGPYQDECANPYEYCNTPYHPYPYSDVAGATGPFLYGPNGHIHREPIVVAQQEVRREEVREQAAPPPEPEPVVAPRSQPEGD